MLFDLFSLSVFYAVFVLHPPQLLHAQVIFRLVGTVWKRPKIWLSHRNWKLRREKFLIFDCTLAAAANIIVCLSNVRANSSPAGASYFFFFLPVHSIHCRFHHQVSIIVSVLIARKPGIFQLINVCQFLKMVFQF